MASWLSSWLQKVRTPWPRKRPTRRFLRPRLELLEDRIAPTLKIIPDYAPSLKSDSHAAQIEAGIEQAIKVLQQYVANNLTIKVRFEKRSLGLSQPAIKIENGGNGYTPKAQVKIEGGDGSGATADAVVTDGVITEIKIKDSGHDYIANPKITIVDSRGSGARVSAELKFGLGASSATPVDVPYASYLAALNKSKTSSDDQLALDNLPSGPTLPAELQNAKVVQLAPNLARALGLIHGLVLTGLGAQVEFTASGGTITAVNEVPTQAGTGYPKNSTFNLYVGGGFSGGTGGIVQATTDETGKVIAFAPTPLAAGSGYETGEAITISGGATVWLNTSIMNFTRPATGNDSGTNSILSPSPFTSSWRY